MLAVVFGLASCTTESTKESALIGTWELESSVVVMDGVEVTLTPEELDMTMSMTFMANNVASITLNGELATGTYEVKGNQLIVDGDAFTFTLVGKKLTLYSVDETDGTEVRLIFAKK